MTLQQRIDALENKRWELILQGAEVCPAKQIQFERLTKKLDRLYAWLAHGMIQLK